MKPLGLTILGFPCNQFGKQEPGQNHEILPALKWEVFLFRCKSLSGRTTYIADLKRNRLKLPRVIEIRRKNLPFRKPEREREMDNFINPHWEKEGFGILFKPVEDWETWATSFS